MEHRRLKGKYRGVGERSILQILRCRLTGWLQLLLMLAWTLQPYGLVRANYVTFEGYDENGDPILVDHPDDEGPDTDGDGLHDGFETWVSATFPDDWDSDDDGYADGDSYNSLWTLHYTDGVPDFVLRNAASVNAQTACIGDVDGDGVPNWDDAYPLDPLDALGDPDGDGVIDMFDPYPDDPHDGEPPLGWWESTEWVHGLEQLIAGDYWSADDTDGDGIPDELDPFLNDATNQTSWWAGGAFWIDGANQLFDETAYDSVINPTDADEDGIPDMFDLYPYDETNNTSWWSGDEWVDGSLLSLPGGAYATDAVLPDTDGDGMLDLFDPYPEDATNNTSWWNGGGTFWTDGHTVYLNGLAYASTMTLADADADGIPDLWDPYVSDATNNNSWWNGGDWWVDGVEETLGAEAYATSGGLTDTDEDGVPDAWDPYPTDPTNNTSWWNGGDWWVDGVQETFTGDGSAYARTAADSDGDGIPDAWDSYDNDATNNTSWWTGGTFWVSGTEQVISSAAYATSGGLTDADGDGIPDFWDSFDADATNDTFWWNGGDWWVDALLQSYEGDGNPYARSTSDSDGDGIPDAEDPYPNDPTNNTSWWYGGSWYIDGSYQSLAAIALATDTADWTDSDEDGIPDVADPYVNDDTNNTTSWAGGTWWVDGLEQLFDYGYFATADYDWGDDDSDGIPNAFDPYYDDLTNNTTEWSGGTWWVDGGEQQFEGGHFATTDYDWGDDDSDGIPNAFDPYYDDATNNTIMWSGGAWWVNGQEISIVGGYFAAAGFDSDSDGDGIPDSLDPYSADPTNNTSWWNGDYWVSGALTSLNAGYATDSDPYSWADSDFDGIPDFADPFPLDPTNNTLWWYGGTWWVDAVAQNFEGDDQVYVASESDSDRDGIPDFADPYPLDPANHTGWWNGDFLISGELLSLSAPYSLEIGVGSDWDGDGIPDIADPMPFDPYNNTLVWNGGDWWINGLLNNLSGTGEVFQASAYDSDGDGIPDTYDPYPADPENNTSWWGGNYFLVDGLSQFYGGAYQAAYSPEFPDLYGDADTDGDGLLDVFDPYPNDPENNTSWWYGGYYLWINGVLALPTGAYATDSYVDADEDGIMDSLSGDADLDGIPDIFDRNPDDATNNTSWFHGGLWRVDGIQTHFDDLNLTYATAGGDADEDGIPDLIDPYPLDATNNSSWWAGGAFWLDGLETELEGGYYATSSGDADGDGIPDVFDTMAEDATNGTSWWDGGNALISGIDTHLLKAYSTTGGYDSLDTDEDGIPDLWDLFALDATNDTSWSSVGQYWVSGLEQTLGGAYATSFGNADTDGDGLLDALDPFPEDATNNTSWWSGGDFLVNGVSVTYGVLPYATTGETDTDGDGIPDALDPYTDDATNHSLWWAGGTFEIWGVGGEVITGGETLEGSSTLSFNSNVVIFPEGYWNGLAGDFDQDGIPDAADLYPLDAGNGRQAWTEYVLAANPFDGSAPEEVTPGIWLGAWFGQEAEARNARPLYLSVTGMTDTDADGIPDVLEDYFGLDPEEPLDAYEDRYGTGYTNLEYYLAGQNLNDGSDPWKAWMDDFIPNVWKVHYGFSLLDPAIWLGDPDNDGQTNFAEYLAGTDPLNPPPPDSDGDGASDADELLAGTDPDNPLSYPSAGGGGGGGSGGSGSGGSGGTGGGANPGGTDSELAPTVNPRVVFYSRHREGWAVPGGFGSFDGVYYTTLTTTWNMQYSTFYFSSYSDPQTGISGDFLETSSGSYESFDMFTYNGPAVSGSKNVSFSTLSWEMGKSSLYTESHTNYSNGTSEYSKATTIGEMAQAPIFSGVTNIKCTAEETGEPTRTTQFTEPGYWSARPVLPQLVMLGETYSLSGDGTKEVSKAFYGIDPNDESTDESVTQLGMMTLEMMREYSGAISKAAVVAEAISDMEHSQWSAWERQSNYSALSMPASDPSVYATEVEYFVTLEWPVGYTPTAEQQGQSYPAQWDEKYASYDGSMRSTQARFVMLQPGTASQIFTLSAAAVNAAASGTKSVSLAPPAEVKVYKKGATSPPLNGLVVKWLDIVVFEVTGLDLQGLSMNDGDIKWYTSKLKHDGTWTDYQLVGYGQKYDHECLLGIYRVRCNVKNVGEIQFKRKMSDVGPHPVAGIQTEFGPAKVGQPDAFGVALSDLEIAIRNEARKFFRSGDYDANHGVAAKDGFSAVSKYNSLCNIFVAHRAVEAGAYVPAINGTFVGGAQLSFFPPVANQWAGVDDTDHSSAGMQTTIDGWLDPDLTSEPRPGLIMTVPKPGGTGHCGIVDYDGQGISASDRGVVTRNFSTGPGLVYRAPIFVTPNPGDQ